MRLILPIIAMLCTVGLGSTSPALGQKAKNNNTAAPQLALEPVTTRFGEYCRRYLQDNPPLILVGIDRTTRQIRAPEKKGIPAAINDAIAMAEAGDRVIVFTIYDHATSQIVLFDDCKPGRPYSVIGRKQNSVDLNFDLDLFGQLLDRVKENAMAPIPGGQTKQSAIATTIQGVIAHYGTPVKALILMTDLLDTETMGLTPTQVIADHTRQHLIRDMVTSGAIPEMRGAVVRIHGFGLSDKADGKSEYPFITKPVMDGIKSVWRDFFQHARVKDNDIKFIP